jgi:hypothetical protein
MSSPAGPVTRRGATALRLATAILQRMRLERPAGPIWEAADVQWWSRRGRPTDRDGQLFWLDERGEPAAAALATDFGHSVQHDVLTLFEDPLTQRLIWRTAIARAGGRDRGAGAEFPVHPADVVGAAELTAAGYQPAARQAERGSAGYSRALQSPVVGGRAGAVAAVGQVGGEVRPGSRGRPRRAVPGRRGPRSAGLPGRSRRFPRR